MHGVDQELFDLLARPTLAHDGLSVWPRPVSRFRGSRTYKASGYALDSFTDEACKDFI